MKVLHTLDSLNRGGSETHVLDLCRRAAENGLEVVFVATGKGSLEGEFTNACDDFVQLERSGAIDFRLIKRLRDLVKDRNVKVVHAYQPVEMLHCYLATIGLGVKRVLTFQGGGLFLSFKNRLVSKILVPLMDANLAVSAGMYEWLEKDVGVSTDSFQVMHNGIDEMKFADAAPTLRQEFEFTSEKLIAGMVANFVPTDTKDQLTVCRALPSVFEVFPNMHFVFVGAVSDGAEDYFESCKKVCRDAEVDDRVSFLGRRSDVPSIMADLDLFVFSSRHEGFGNVVSEAMLAGVPAIVSDIEPMKEVCRGGDLAELFRTSDHDSLATAMIAMLSDEERRDQLAARAKHYARENYSTVSHIRRVKTLYEELTG